MKDEGLEMKEYRLLVVSLVSNLQSPEEDRT